MSAGEGIFGNSSKRRGSKERRVLRKIFDSVYSPECVERLYEKPSNTGEPPRHEANHGSIHERFAARTKPLVVLAQPPVLSQPGEGTLHDPPPRQEGPWTFRLFLQLLPIDLHSLFGQLSHPSLHHLLRNQFRRMAHYLGTPSQNLLHPIRAFVFSGVSCVQPHLREAR